MQGERIGLGIGNGCCNIIGCDRTRKVTAVADLDPVFRHRISLCIKLLNRIIRTVGNIVDLDIRALCDIDNEGDALCCTVCIAAVGIRSICYRRGSNILCQVNAVGACQADLIGEGNARIIRRISRIQLAQRQLLGLSRVGICRTRC